MKFDVGYRIYRCYGKLNWEFTVIFQAKIIRRFTIVYRFIRKTMTDGIRSQFLTGDYAMSLIPQIYSEYIKHDGFLAKYLEPEMSNLSKTKEE